MDAGTIEVTQEPRGFLMPAEPVPDHQQGALEMPAEVLDKRKDIVACDVGGRDRKIESQTLTHGRDRDGAGHREAVVTVPAVMDRGLPLRGPGAALRGLQHEATLIDQDKGAALTLGFFKAGA